MEVTSPEAVSVAVMSAVLPGTALAATVTRPVVLTLATLEAEDSKDSATALRSCVVPLLKVPTTDSCCVPPGIRETVEGVRAIDRSMGAAPLDEEDDVPPEDDPLELLEVDEAPEDEELLDELEPPDGLDPFDPLDDPPPHPTSALQRKAPNTLLRTSMRMATLSFSWQFHYQRQPICPVDRRVVDLLHNTRPQLGS